MLQSNEKVLYFGRSRVFYHGLIGRVGRERLNGSLTIYAAQNEELSFSIAGGRSRWTRIAAVPPQTPHRVQCPDDRVTVILIESETVDPVDLAALMASIVDGAGAEALWRQIALARRILQTEGFPADMAPGAFDAVVVGRNLARRDLDPRIARALDLFETCDLAECPTAEDLARAVRISVSRFLRLFKEETGLRFRSFRMWRRARAFLPHAANTENLAHLALELGYPDSTHFSHSIRRIFGLKPRSILEGSRQMRVFTTVPNPAIHEEAIHGRLGGAAKAGTIRLVETRERLSVR